MKNSENKLLPEESKSFISVTNGVLCNQIYRGFNKRVNNRHPSKGIKVILEVTSIPPNDDVTGERIYYLEEKTVAPNSHEELGCDVPGPTSQRFIWNPLTAEWS